MALIACLALAGLGVGVLLVLPWFVRRAVVERASRRDVEVSIGRVRLGLGSLWLLDIGVSDERAPERRAHIDAVKLSPSLGGTMAIRVQGAQIRLVGSAAELRARWRSTQKQSVPADSASSERSMELAGVDVSWTLNRTDRLDLWGVRASRDERGVVEGSADRSRFATERASFEARAVSGNLGLAGTERRTRRIEAAEAMLRLDLDAPETREGAHGPGDPRGATPAKPSLHDGGAFSGGGRPARKVRDVPASGLGPVGSGVNAAGAPGVPTTHALSKPLESELGSAWRDFRQKIEELTDQRFSAAVVALSVEARRGGEALRIGPSQLTLTRQGNELSAAILPHAATSNSGTPVTARAKVPLRDGPIELDLSGGPVSLSALGVREGDFGLMGVRDARLEADVHVALDQQLHQTRVTSKGRLENVRLRRPALASTEISGIRLGWRLNGEFSLDGRKLSVEEAEVSLGDVRARLSGTVERNLGRSIIDVSGEVPVAACGSLIESLPRGMAPLLDGVRMQGTFAVEGSLSYDSEKPAATQARLVVKNQCRISEVPPAISPNRFRSVWHREVMGPDGLPMPLESGPGSREFTPYEEISPYLETAIVVCEDAGFFRHQGLDYRAIESSLKQNLAVGRFLRGASTVSMQLAKNLYLGREKTLSRKLQEAVLTLLLEQELSKHELMELYLNVIEFGPGVYGVRQAARYYFNEEPRDLSLAQALYLGSILPSPDSSHFLPDGRVSPGWSEYLRKLMHVARKIGRISQEELERGLLEQVEFRKPSSEADRSSGINSESNLDSDTELPLPPFEDEPP